MRATVARWIVGILGSIAIVLGACQTLTFGETWPQRAVRLIVPHSAATGSNVSARLVAERLAERWKRPVIVENRPGADGLTGVTAFVTMRDDHALRAVAADPTMVERLVAVGQVPRGSTPGEFAASIDEQRVQIATLAKAMEAARK